jgi:hypothetical protein
VFQRVQPRLQFWRDHPMSIKSRSFSLAARSLTCRSSVAVPSDESAESEEFRRIRTP